jgi:predicted metal-dependent phosphoesterase TrpH
MAIDLHLHSTASDGTLTPEEIVKLASRFKLRAIALTDHDSVEGIPAALKSAQKYGIEVIPAVELSSDLEGRDIHFLGYYIDHTSEMLLKHLKNLRKLRFERAVRMVERLRGIGIDIPLQEVIEKAGSGAVGRAHLARVMVDKGFIDNIEEAFERYIGRKAPCYIEKYIYTPEEVIDIIRRAGGIAVLAHPGLSRVDEYIREFIDHGLKGLEIYHSDHSKDDVRFYRSLAQRMGLIVTGGSDCHGLDSNRGLVIGSVKVPDSVLNGLNRSNE